MDLPIDRLRAETPGCAHVTHFNHAGASLMPQRVLDTVVGHQVREAEIGGYEAADEQHGRIDAVYDHIAALLGAIRTEIALIENATRAWDMAFHSIPFQSDDRILTSRAEYSSNVISFLQMRDRGVTIEVIPNDASGQVDVAALAEMMDERVRLVAISHMPTNGGLVQPAAAIGAVVRKWPALYLLDACQSIGQMPVDVAEIGCDMLSATSRKYLRGPRGAGFLYVRQALISDLTPPMLDNHAADWISIDEYQILPDARRFENWERSFANLLGLGEAVQQVNELGLPAIWDVIQDVATRFRSALRDVPGITITDIGAVQSGIVTFVLDGVEPDTVKDVMHSQGINVTTSSVLSTRYDMEARHLDKVVRASIHYLTTDREIDQLLDVLQRMGKGHLDA